MAEWSKAPDSRFYLTFMIGSVYREFWSSYEGVGSNPTSDSNFLEITPNVSWQQFKNEISSQESLSMLIFVRSTAYNR